eukprot:6083265-Prymnesium_polylepis.1
MDTAQRSARRTGWPRRRGVFARRPRSVGYDLPVREASAQEAKHRRGREPRRAQSVGPADHCALTTVH